MSKPWQAYALHLGDIDPKTVATVVDLHLEALAKAVKTMLNAS